MKLTIYKGFDAAFLDALHEDPLVDGAAAEKKNVLSFDKKTKKKLDIALLEMDSDDSYWMTYEEYTIIKTRVDEAVLDDGLQLIMFRNNIYPDYYPIGFEVSADLEKEIARALNTDSTATSSEECQSFLAVYNSLISVDGKLYGSFYNFEYDRDASIPVKDYYPSRITVEDGHTAGEYNVFLNEDVETYLRDLSKIMETHPNIVGLKSTEGLASKRMQNSLQTYCVANNIRLVKYYEVLPEDAEREQELIAIAKEDIGIVDFSGFRNIKFYKNLSSTRIRILIKRLWNCPKGK